MHSWAEALEGPERRMVRRNFAANVMDGAFFALALSFVSQQTVLPVYVRTIGGGNIAVGLIPVLWTFGFNFPQILIAPFAQRTRRKHRLLLLTAMGQRIPWLLLALVPYLLYGRVGTGAGLLAFFLLFFLAAVGGSINLPVWFDLIAKLTPVTARGRLFALRGMIGSLLGILGGATATFVLGSIPPPGGFALLFILAFAAMMASYAFLVRLQEGEEQEGSAVPVQEWDGAHLRLLLRTRVNYRNFVVGDALLITSTMANAFFALHALVRFGLSDAYAGTFTILIMCSTMVGGLLFGVLADRYGHRLNMLLSSLCTLLGCLIAIVAPTKEIYALTFVFSAFSATLGGISRLPLMAELCSTAERPSVVALSNMLTSPFVLAGIAGGWIADRLGYEGTFAAAGAIALVAMVWWSIMVKEPRSSAAHTAGSAGTAG